MESSRTMTYTTLASWVTSQRAHVPLAATILGVVVVDDCVLDKAKDSVEEQRTPEALRVLPSFSSERNYCGDCHVACDYHYDYYYKLRLQRKRVLTNSPARKTD